MAPVCAQKKKILYLSSPAPLCTLLDRGGLPPQGAGRPAAMPGPSMHCCCGCCAQGPETCERWTPNRSGHTRAARAAGACVDPEMLCLDHLTGLGTPRWRPRARPALRRRAAPAARAAARPAPRRSPAWRRRRRWSLGPLCTWPLRARPRSLPGHRLHGREVALLWELTSGSPARFLPTATCGTGAPALVMRQEGRMQRWWRSPARPGPCAAAGSQGVLGSCSMPIAEIKQSLAPVSLGHGCSGAAVRHSSAHPHGNAQPAQRSAPVM